MIFFVSTEGAANEGLFADILDCQADGLIAGEMPARAGHTRIAHIAGWLGSSTGRERRDGFLAGLGAEGSEAAACFDGMYSRETAREQVLVLFADSGACSGALFVGSDNMAFAVMDTLRSELVCAYRRMFR